MSHEQDWKPKREAVGVAAAAGQIAPLLRATRELLGCGKASDISFCATTFRKLRDELVAHGHQPLKTFIVRSVTVEPILPALHVEAVLGGYVLEVQVGGYGSYMEELLNPDSSLGRAAADLVIVLLDPEEIAGQLPEVCARGGGEEIARELDASVGRVGQMLRSYRAAHAGRLVFCGCVLPEVTSLGAVGSANLPHSLLNTLKRLNGRLADLCGTIPDCRFFDTDAVAAAYGRDHWRDRRMYLASRLPLASGAFRPLARGLMRSASTLFRAPRKVLCTDLDNTLWGGVLGEDGPGGIATGSAFPGNCYLEYQRFMKELAARGILLAVTSKNNEADVAEAFRMRAADLGLTLDDFVARKIGWNEKAEALRELSAELSLGLDSFVFVDDNPVECEAIRQHLPEVAVVEVPVSEPWRTVELLAEAWYFDAAAVTADDRNRTGEYRAQAQRAALASGTASREEFLGSLGIVCTFLSLPQAPLPRAAQLLAKTNQFNLTTRRHSESALMAFVEDPDWAAVAVRVRDRFGDAGVVGLALARREGERCLIDSLLLSCRVIGRGIETALLAHLAERAWAAGCRWLVGEYIPTAKNAPCKDFYPDHRFAQEGTPSGEGAVVYRLDLSHGLPESPAWLTLEGHQPYELTASIALPS